MNAFAEIISEFAGFQYTPVFKKSVSSGASTPSRKSSEVSNQRRHSVIIAVGVSPIPKLPQKTD